MFLNFSAGDKGNFKFPKEFIQRHISEKWRKILEIAPGYLIKSPVDLVSW